MPFVCDQCSRKRDEPPVHTCFIERLICTSCAQIFHNGSNAVRRQRAFAEVINATTMERQRRADELGIQTDDTDRPRKGKSNERKKRKRK